MFICLFILPPFLSFHHSSLHPPPGRPGWPLVKSGHPSLSEITTRVESNYPPTSELFVSFRWRPCRDTIATSLLRPPLLPVWSGVQHFWRKVLGLHLVLIILRCFFGGKKKRCWEWLIHGGARISFWFAIVPCCCWAVK